MKLKDLLKNYFRKLVFEAIIKAITIGLVIGFSAAFIIKIWFFFMHNNSILIPILVGLGTSIICSFVLYFFKYQPKLSNVASRVDGLGLDERIITSLDIEKKNIDSYIAKKQQDDARMHLSKVSTKQLRLKLFSIPTMILLLLIPLTVGSMAISNNPSSSNISTDLPEDDFSKEIEEIRSIIRNSNIYNIQKNELYKMVDELVDRLRTYETLSEKTNDIKKTKEEIISKIEEYVIGNLLDILRGVINEAEVKNEFKETLHQKVDEFETNISKTATLSKKIETVKEFVNELQDLIIDEAVKELRILVAEADASQDLKDQANGLIDDLEYRIENVHETYGEKMEDIKETKEEILKLLYPEMDPTLPTPIDDLDDLGEELQDAIDEALKDLEDLEGEIDEEELEGELPIEPEIPIDEEGEESELPPPPLDGEIHNDFIIDGLTPYLPELEKKLPGITDMLAQGDIPEDIKQLVQSYLELITKNQGQD